MKATLPHSTTPRYFFSMDGEKFVEFVRFPDDRDNHQVTTMWGEEWQSVLEGKNPRKRAVADVKTLERMGADFAD